MTDVSVPAASGGGVSGASSREEIGSAGKGGAGVPDGDAAGPDADGILAYRIGLGREARRHHHRYPPLARERGWTGTAEIEVDVSRQGRPRHILLARSSGHDILDREALAIMTRAAASVALPSSLRGQAFSVRLPVEFELTDSR
jgi:protein TonB